MEVSGVTLRKMARLEALQKKVDEVSAHEDSLVMMLVLSNLL